jgi:hypothetical protein
MSGDGERMGEQYIYKVKKKSSKKTEKDELKNEKKMKKNKKQSYDTRAYEKKRRKNKLEGYSHQRDDSVQYKHWDAEE